MLSISTKCPCGEDVSGHIQEPKALQPTILKMTCDCGSKFLARCRRKNQKYAVDFKLLNLSKRSEDVVAVDLGLKEPEVL